MEKPIILIVDDNRDLRETLAALLGAEGYQGECCEHGAAALAYLRTAKRHPALIVLDLMMPVMNGWQFRDRQLEDAALSAIPVVGMTANRDAPALRDVRATLLKPFGMDEFLQIVDRCRARRRPRPPGQTIAGFKA